MSRFVEALVTSARENPRSDPASRGLSTGEPEQPRRRTWGAVHDRALRVGAALREPDGEGSARVVRPGDSVAILAADPDLIASAVQGVWLIGGSVTMLHQPTPRTDLSQWAKDTLRTLGMIGAHVVLLGAPFDELADVLTSNGIDHRMLADLVEAEAATVPTTVPEDTTALLQLTSGSTAEPKAVRITHANLYANLTGMVKSAQLDVSRDVVVSWLPLFHDMGMVGCLTVPMAIGMEAVKVTPADFLLRPTLWPELISRYRGTVTAAPNFAFAITARRMANCADDAFDLSGLRFALNGGEPIDPEAVRSFSTAGARFGLRSEAVVAAYGMAEATLAVSIEAPERGVDVEVIDADRLERDGMAEPTSPDAPRARRFAALGPPLPGVEVEVVAGSGHRLGPGQVGRLRVRGEAVTSEYLTVAGPRAAQDADGWLDTGDDGYLTGADAGYLTSADDGRIVICGRSKDVIIMGGRNIYPVDIERAACDVEGVRAGNAAAVRLDAGSRRERFAVVLESRLAGDAEAERGLRKSVAAAVLDAVGARPAAVDVAPPGSLPKTPSGKIKRAAASELVAE